MSTMLEFNKYFKTNVSQHCFMSFFQFSAFCLIVLNTFKGSLLLKDYYIYEYFLGTYDFSNK